MGEFEKATPRPWSVEEDSNGQPNLYGPDGHDQWVALFPHQCVASLEETARDNAALSRRAVNAFEPMRKALDMLGEQIKVRIDPGLLEELGRAGVGDITIRADVLLACLRALQAADETTEGR